MTRAKTELAAALVVALSLVILLAWYQGRRMPDASESVPFTGPVVRSESVTGLINELPANPVPSTVANTAPATNVAGAPAAPTPQLPADVLERDRAFINEAFPTLSSWSVSEVKPLLSTAALNASTDEELAEVMTILDARLGDLQYFEPPQPVNTTETTEDASASLQPYTFTAYYEAGAAEVNLVLEKEQQRSSLYSFDINVQN